MTTMANGNGSSVNGNHDGATLVRVVETTTGEKRRRPVLSQDACGDVRDALKMMFLHVFSGDFSAKGTVLPDFDSEACTPEVWTEIANRAISALKRSDGIVTNEDAKRLRAYVDSLVAPMKQEYSEALSFYNSAPEKIRAKLSPPAKRTTILLMSLAEYFPADKRSEADIRKAVHAAKLVLAKGNHREGPQLSVALCDDAEETK